MVVLFPNCHYERPSFGREESVFLSFAKKQIPPPLARARDDNSMGNGSRA